MSKLSKEENAHLEYLRAREELKACADLVHSLSKVDQAKDVTGQSSRLARSCLGDAATAYATAVAEHRGGADEDRRRRQAQKIADAPVATHSLRGDEEGSAA
jgi:hypothetical protein